VVAEHHHHHPPGRHRDHADAAEDRAVAEDRSEAVDYPPLQTRSSLDAYDTFSRAATTQALNVVIDA
jgi:hypothetical protein